MRFKAFLNQFLLAVTLYKFAAMIFRGFVDSIVMTQAAYLAPMAVVGIFAGAHRSVWFSSVWFSSVWFERSVAATLIAIAIVFVIFGV